MQPCLPVALSLAAIVSRGQAHSMRRLGSVAAGRCGLGSDHAHRTRTAGQTAGNTLAEFEHDLADNLCYERGTTAKSASLQDAYWTLAVTIRDRLAHRRARTARANYRANRSSSITCQRSTCWAASCARTRCTPAPPTSPARASPRPASVEDLEVLDVEPGLGNGGLGRLAACLLDSLATLDMPGVGYGIRYEFGIFKQAFEDGYQVEHPDDWTFYGNPWEFPAPDDRQVVGFYGHTEPVNDDQGGLRARWVPGETVRGEPSHMLVPGYGTETVNIIRLWQARAARESFDLALFNAGHYAEAVESQMRSEHLTKVLYPSDSTPPARNCGSSSSTSWSPARCGTSSAGSGSATATGTPSRTRSSSSSTTPIRCWPSPS